MIIPLCDSKARDNSQLHNKDAPKNGTKVWDKLHFFFFHNTHYSVKMFPNRFDLIGRQQGRLQAKCYWEQHLPQALWLFKKRLFFFFLPLHLNVVCCRIKKKKSQQLKNNFHNDIKFWNHFNSKNVWCNMIWPNVQTGWWATIQLHKAASLKSTWNIKKALLTSCVNVLCSDHHRSGSQKCPDTFPDGTNCQAEHSSHTPMSCIISLSYKTSGPTTGLIIKEANL